MFSQGTEIEYTGTFQHYDTLDKFLYLGKGKIKKLIVTDDKVTEVHIESPEEIIFTKLDFIWTVNVNSKILLDNYNISIKTMNNHIGVKYRRKSKEEHTVSNRNTVSILDNLLESILGKELESEEYEDGRDSESTYGIC